MRLCITGSVGTGKTTLAKKLAKTLELRYLDVRTIIKEHKLDQEYDKKRKCSIIDVKKLNKVLLPLPENVIVDSHLSHYLPKKSIDLCIVTRCDLKTLHKRLEKRKYSENKIKENLEAEIFEVCLQEAQSLHKVLVIDTSKKLNFKEVIKNIHEALHPRID